MTKVDKARYNSVQTLHQNSFKVDYRGEGKKAPKID